MGCLFCNIVDKKIPADIILENEHALAFKDLNPQAPSHALVIPKRHLSAIADATPEDGVMLGAVMLAAREVAEGLGLAKGGYRLVINNGSDGGQSVFHLHVHVLGGRQLAWPPG